ncbi:hypothetical protein MN608_01861 [Microdochium nivale]|nr:hypothetical protein MN608_01861 [Microdochium nivale]
MDDFMFHTEVRACTYVPEATSYLEIFIYSDDTIECEQHPLTDEDFDNFLHRKGAFAPPTLKTGVELVSGMRLVIQKDAKKDNTFAPRCISIKPDMYEAMVKTMHLPTRGIEGSALVGPCFWAAYDQDEDDQHLQIIFRKSDVRKKGKTRGWESMLSYEFKTGITTGYVKGTESSDIVVALEHLINCQGDVGHPMLLPMIIMAHDLSTKIDSRQREARHWLRRLENAITLRDEVVDSDVYTDFDVDVVNRDLVECHSQVLWKRPQAYREIIKDMEAAMAKFDAKIVGSHRSKSLVALHHNMLSRLDFYRVKLTSMEHYIHTTLERLTIQRQALYNIMAQRESKLNLEMAAQQRRLAHASKRDSTAMKALSLLGAMFLPGTFVASLLSMSFFDFNVGPNYGPDADTSGQGADVSREVWIYFVITVPLTLLIVGTWWFLDHRRERLYEAEDLEIEAGITSMETDILAIMRKKTMSKASTWQSPGPA